MPNAAEHGNVGRNTRFALGACAQAWKDFALFDVLKDEIEEGRQYYESRVPFRVRQDTEIFNETLQQFVNMKREELQRAAAQ